MTAITRDNIDALLDRGAIQLRSHNGRWYNIRRNGATKRWKRDAARIAIPCKVGFRECFTITERDFYSLGGEYRSTSGSLNSNAYRINPAYDD